MGKECTGLYTSAWHSHIYKLYVWKPVVSPGYASPSYCTVHSPQLKAGGQSPEDEITKESKLGFEAQRIRTAKFRSAGDVGGSRIRESGRAEVLEQRDEETA